MSLYTKYRPKDWDSVIGQSYTTTILRNALKLDRVGHAYLFHGSRGTGKTTSARILAKAVNCTDLQNGNPCHACMNCQAFDNESMLDVIEIDAASNTGVDNIRDLIDKARFEPNQGKYKVYIIDEVHMLSTGAFNALLKILEEPPKHVKFILATTEIDKVPETIRSRSQRFDFRKIVDEDIVERLKYICREEHIQAEDTALTLIARTARGGMRDAITLLEQNRMDNEVTFLHVKSTLMIVDEERLNSTIEALKTGDTESLLGEIENLKSGHIHARSYIEQLLYRLRDLLFEHIHSGEYVEYDRIFTIVMQSHGKLRSFPDGMMLIETTLLRALKRETSNRISESTETPLSKKSTPHIQADKPPTPKNESTIIKPLLTKKSEELVVPIEVIPTEKPTSMEKITVVENKEPGGERPKGTLEFSFSKLLQHIKGVKPALFSDLRNARFEIKDSTIVFIFATNWNHDRVNTSTIKHFIAEVMSSLFENEWTIECKLDDVGGTGLSHHAETIF